jgi:phosphatidylglycerol:prolipoprotein diacylglycerol transferase
MLAALGVLLLARRCLPRSAGLALPLRQQAALALAAFVGGAFGAKLPFAFAAGSDWMQLQAWVADGKTVTTGLIGAYLAVELTKAALGIRVKTGDTFALPLALALAVGRWGCFFNGCCFGRPTDLPWAVDFGDGIRRHPTQVYESLFHLGMAGVLLVLMRRGLFRTHRLQLYLIAYGVFRFATEFIRPEPECLLGLTYYQWAALVLVVGPAAQWAWEVWCPTRTSRERERPEKKTPVAYAPGSPSPQH